MSDKKRILPIILDFDDSVLPLAESEVRIPLASWQEAVRFGCSHRTFAALETHLQSLVPVHPGPVFLGSGDFHHLTLFLLHQIAKKVLPNSIDIVVCDNHPDNMRYPFGIHCGSWVFHAARLDSVRSIHVIGITSEDISFKHAWENHLSPFLSKKLSYWSIKQEAGWLRFMGRKNHIRTFSSPDALLNELLPVLMSSEALYLSIDKDVFDPHVVRTNWDQGVFAFSHLQRLLNACTGRLIGADITGDVSQYTYSSPFKRFLSRLDGQSSCDLHTLRSWQSEQHAMNLQLLQLLNASF